ncbi:hypothetical protein [Streptosporangium sp. KLBMP 9127]|nr:hypothetical protein [Streptosporangium sp. KLBMP 9127]
MLGLSLAGAAALGTSTAAHADDNERALLNGSTKASYFWDDASGRAGDTGLPAIGKPMEKGMFASPSWPLGTEGYVTYKGKKAEFFIGDRGPGTPSNSGVMLDIDAKTFADLTGGKFNSSSLMVTGNGGMGHIKVDYTVTKWGAGVGKKNHPVAFSTGAWGKKDKNPAKPPEVSRPQVKAAPGKSAGNDVADTGAVVADGGEDVAGDTAKTEALGQREENGASGGVAALAGVGVAGIGLYVGRDRIRRLFSR